MHENTFLDMPHSSCDGCRSQQIHLKFFCKKQKMVWYYKKTYWYTRADPAALSTSPLNEARKSIRVIKEIICSCILTRIFIPSSSFQFW